MIKSSLQTIQQFKLVLLNISDEQYCRSCETLSGATIGQHSRHIIELYLCLIDGYDSGKVCYDKRKRDRQIETDIPAAVSHLNFIMDKLERNNKDLQLFYELDGREVSIHSNYFREVMYNLEHAIHHEALIKIAIAEFTELKLPDSFGVAPSTLQYRNQCVQ